MAKKNEKVAVVVTTSYRGVFFGYVDAPSDAQTIRIENARMCVRWSEDVRSVVGLASSGPSAGCRIGPAVPAITLRDVTAVIECSAEAAQKFETAPWSK